MSILQELIQVIEEVKIDEIKTFIPQMEASLKSCQTDVETFIENVYVTYREKPKRNRYLANKLNELNEEINDFNHKVLQSTNNELTEANDELQDLLKSLEKLKCFIDYLQQISQIHEALQEINTLLNSNEFILCAEKIEEVEKIFENLHNDGLFIKALSSIRKQFCVQKAELRNLISQIFEDNIILIPSEKNYCLKVKTDRNDLIKQALQALYRKESSISHLDDITRFLWEICISVVDHTTQIELKSDNHWNVLNIKVVDVDKKLNYLQVFNNITTILEFLSKNFNHKLDENFTTLNYIGRDLSDNLSELIIKHCLQDRIPTDSKDLKNKKEIVENTQILENKLISIGIFTEQTTSLVQYVNNFDTLFMEKKCENYLLIATDLMKRDLHDMIEIDGIIDRDVLTMDNKFTNCSISKNVIEILKFVQNILQELQTTKAECLLKTVKMILKKYPQFVAEHHRKLLQTIPQQIALFYNNCQYIGHVLANWQISYNHKLPENLKDDYSFVEEIQKLQHISTDVFNNYVGNQIKQINEILKDSDLNHQQTLENVNDNVEKLLRQCLRQQELLKTVWHRVLPYEIYNKVIGQILDCLCLNLINSIVRFEDISTKAAEQLSELIKMIQIRAPKLFTDPNEISLFVENWCKLNELYFVLNASLIEINDRWATGKGPLAIQFKPAEIRQLIRALFQNTERRAALLSKIYD